MCPGGVPGTGKEGHGVCACPAASARKGFAFIPCVRYWRFTDKARTPGHRFGIPKRTPRNAIADTPPQKEL